MSTLAPARTVVLDRVRHGLVDPAGDCRDLEAVLTAARYAERDGAAALVGPAHETDRPGTPQALAVLLATSTIAVVLPVAVADADPVALGRWAGSATALAGDRVVLQVVGDGADDVAGRLREQWAGRVVVDTEGAGTTA